MQLSAFEAIDCQLRCGGGTVAAALCEVFRALVTG